MKENHPLWQIALNQGGLFTSQQAVSAGIDSRNHAYHIKAKNWLKVEKGIYKLKNIEESQKTKFFLYQLWARNKTGKTAGAFSYETALYLMGLRTKYPQATQAVRFHITVSNRFRKTPSKKFHSLVLHYEDLDDNEKTIKDYLHITSIKKTFQDLINAGSYHPEWLKQQFKQALEKQMISYKEIKNLSVPEKFKRTFTAILFELS